MDGDEVNNAVTASEINTKTIYVGTKEISLVDWIWERKYAPGKRPSIIIE